MITDKQLEQCGFISSTVEDPANKNKYVTFKKGFLKVLRVHIYNYETERYVKADPTVILSLPISPVWDREAPLHHIKNIDKLRQLDKLLNDN